VHVETYTMTQSVTEVFLVTGLLDQFMGCVSDFLDGNSIFGDFVGPGRGAPRKIVKFLQFRIGVPGEEHPSKIRTISVDFKPLVHQQNVVLAKFPTGDRTVGIGGVRTGKNQRLESLTFTSTLEFPTYGTTQGFLGYTWFEPAFNQLEDLQGLIESLQNTFNFGVRFLDTLLQNPVFTVFFAGRAL